MADTLKTYAVRCPNPDCAEEFTIERTPEMLVDDGELIPCPACKEEWEWEFEPEAGIITLMEDDFKEDRLEEDFEDDDDDEEDDDED